MSVKAENKANPPDGSSITERIIEVASVGFDGRNVIDQTEWQSDHEYGELRDPEGVDGTSIGVWKKLFLLVVAENGACRQ